MRFDLVRQPLVPAFLSLVIFMVLAMTHTASSIILSDTYYNLAPESLPIASLQTYVSNFATTFNGWAHIIGGFLVLFSALTIGRMTARFKLYGINTFIAMPLYALALAGMMQSPYWFVGLVASTLLTLVVKNYCYGFRNGFSFDNMFRAAMYLALLTMLYPKAAPLLLTLPMAVILFRRATRESLVALCGLLLPPLTLCYINWGAGGSFHAPMVLLYQQFIDGSWLSVLTQASLPTMIFIGTLIALNLAAYLLFRVNSYILSTRSRNTLLFASYLMLLCISLMLMPDAESTIIGLFAVPSALLLPVFFLRVRRSLAQILYPIVIAGVLVFLLFGC
ncbi:MAG: hypothetical protein IKU77_05795 [Alistipes sp.]|nr:hypothetical protein [Alistipes sp.]